MSKITENKCRYNFKHILFELQKLFMALAKRTTCSSNIPMRLRDVPGVFQYTGRKTSRTHICETSLHLFPSNQKHSQLLVLNHILLCFYFLWVLCLFLCRPLCPLLSLPPLWFALSSPNQEIWPLTPQLNAIKLLSILQLEPARRKQRRLTLLFILALDFCRLFSLPLLVSIIFWCEVFGERTKNIVAFKMQVVSLRPGISNSQEKALLTDFRVSIVYSPFISFIK